MKTAWVVIALACLVGPALVSRYWRPRCRSCGRRRRADLSWFGFFPCQCGDGRPCR